MRVDCVSACVRACVLRYNTVGGKNGSVELRLLQGSCEGCDPLDIRVSCGGTKEGQGEGGMGGVGGNYGRRKGGREIREGAVSERENITLSSLLSP